MTSKEIAKVLLDIGAVKLNFENRFQWVSGIKSPIYCDNRLIISAVKARKQVASAFAELIETKYPQTTLIAGTATAGIPHAAWVADLLELPMIYIRSKPKEHGTKSLIEGSYSSSDKVIVIEDLISTGKSSIQAGRAISDLGLDLLAVCSIFSYELEKSKKAFSEASIRCHNLAGVGDLIELGQETAKLSDKQSSELRDFFSQL